MMMKKMSIKRMVKLFACGMLSFALFIGNGVPTMAIEQTEITSPVKGAKINKKAKKAIEAYQVYLGKDWIKWSNNSYRREDFKFFLADINRDSVPELFLHCGKTSCAEGHETVYYYKNGKVTNKGMNKEEWIPCYYPSKGVVLGRIEKQGGREEFYYKISKNKNAYKLAYSSMNIQSGKGSYTWKNKKVTVSKFKSYLNKAAGKKIVNVKESDWYENTAENRENMSRLIKEK